MPIFLITSPTGVPVSACRSAKAICSSLYRVFFIRQPSLQAAHFAGFSLSSPGPLFGEDLRVRAREPGTYILLFAYTVANTSSGAPSPKSPNESRVDSKPFENQQ